MSINLSKKKSIYNEKFNELTKLIEEIKETTKNLVNSKDFNIEIQGDKRNVLKTELEKKGFTVKLAGG